MLIIKNKILAEVDDRGRVAIQLLDTTCLPQLSGSEPPVPPPGLCPRARLPARTEAAVISGS